MSLRKAHREGLAPLVTPDLASGVPVGGGTMDGSGGAITSLWSLGCGRAVNTVAEPQGRSAPGSFAGIAVCGIRYRSAIGHGWPR